MQVLHPRCCGIDVHKERLAACVRVQAGQRAKVEVRLFDTTTSALLSLSEWLAGEGCTHVAMESTSVYWKPVFNILEGQFEVILATASGLPISWRMASFDRASSHPLPSASCEI